LNLNRLKKLNNKSIVKGSIFYWCIKEHRINDNWALETAIRTSIKQDKKLIIVFSHNKTFEYTSKKVKDFAIESIKDLKKSYTNIGIEYIEIKEETNKECYKLLAFLQNNAGAVFTDITTIRPYTNWVKYIKNHLECALYEVDSRFYVPIKASSNKEEYAIASKESKEHKDLKDWINKYIDKGKIKAWKSYPQFKLEKDSKEQEALDTFIEFKNNKVSKYQKDRNNPNIDAQSNLSPYIRFGNISVQKIVNTILKENKLEPIFFKDIKKNMAGKTNIKATLLESICAFVEEITVRRELAANYCLYNKNYSNTKGFHAWSQKNTEESKKHIREYIYTIEDFENKNTHDALWNTCQKQMEVTGKMQGYLRMYWAKKILEWTKNREEAMNIAIYLNDKYSIDGRDANGYAGIAWSIGGVHDRAWQNNNVFGKVRYMNLNGMKRKFKVEQFIEKWK